MSQLVRVDDDAHDTLRRLAEEEDRPMTRVLGSAIDLYDEIRLAKIAGPRVELSDRSADAIADLVITDAELRGHTCTHPKDKERRFVWGTVCGACGTRIR